MLKVRKKRAIKLPFYVNTQLDSNCRQGTYYKIELGICQIFLGASKYLE